MAATDDHRELRDVHAGDRSHQLGTVLRDATGFVLPPDHEAGDVLEKHEWDLALTAELHKVGALQAGFGEQDAVVGDDPHQMAVNARKAADQRGAVPWLEFVEARSVHDPRDEFTDVNRRTVVFGHDGQQLLRVVVGIFGLGACRRGKGAWAQILDDVPHLP